jgi:uncharacterized protein HemY
MNPGFPAFDAEATQLYEQMGLKSEFINEAYPNLKEAQEFRQLVEQGRESYLKKFWLSISISRRSRWEKSYELARIAARLGKKDTAFELLNQAYRGRDHYMTQLKVDPAFDSLRSDPHFDELLRRMNLASPR